MTNSKSHDNLTATVFEHVLTKGHLNRLLPLLQQLEMIIKETNQPPYFTFIWKGQGKGK